MLKESVLSRAERLGMQYAEYVAGACGDECKGDCPRSAIREEIALAFGLGVRMLASLAGVRGDGEVPFEAEPNLADPEVLEELGWWKEGLADLRESLERAGRTVRGGDA